MSRPDATVARYELVETIASGGMARVFLGRARDGADDEHPAPVAVKILHPHLAADPEAVALFLDEARVATRIRHPNVVEVRDVDMVGEDLTIIMEYVEGMALSSMIRSLRDAGSVIPLPVIVRVVVGALRGLHAAHELTDESGAPMHIVHRDVSPHNVIVGADGVARVADFGVATSVGRLAQTRTGAGVRGKLQYLAPEQIHRHAPDRRVDVWAAGLVLWECLTGKRLFDGGTEAETIADTLRAPIPPPSTLRSDATFELDEICLRALERDPTRRFESAAAFADALERESGVRPASAEDVAALVFQLEGATLLERRKAFERGRGTPAGAGPVQPNEPVTRTAPTVLAPLQAPVRAASTSTAPASLALPLAATSPPATIKPRGNKLALLAVAAISLVIGGLGVRFAGARAGSDARATATATAAATSPPTSPTAPPPPTATTEPTSIALPESPSSSAQLAAAPPRASSALPPRAVHPPDKKRGAPKAAPSSSERPFMPAEL